MPQNYYGSGRFIKFIIHMMAIHVLKKVLEKYENAYLCMVGPKKDKTIHDCKRACKRIRNYR